MFSQATTFYHNRFQLWPHSSTSYYSSCLLFTMSVTCWNQTSLLLSHSQRNHQQLKKRKWVPSGQIRMCNTSYSNTAFLPQILNQRCNYTICLFYIMIVYRCTAHFIICPIKQGEQHAKGHSGGKANQRGDKRRFIYVLGGVWQSGKKGRGDACCTTGSVVIKTSIKTKEGAFMCTQHHRHWIQEWRWWHTSWGLVFYMHCLSFIILGYIFY